MESQSEDLTLLTRDGLSSVDIDSIILRKVKLGELAKEVIEMPLFQNIMVEVSIRENERGEQALVFMEMALKLFVNLKGDMVHAFEVLKYINLSPVEKRRKLIMMFKLLRSIEDGEFEALNGVPMRFFKLFMAMLETLLDTKEFQTLIKQFDDSLKSCIPHGNRLLTFIPKINEMLNFIIFPYLMIYPELFYGCIEEQLYLTSSYAQENVLKIIPNLIEFKHSVAIGTMVDKQCEKVLARQQEEFDGTTLIMLASLENSDTYKKWFSYHEKNCWSQKRTIGDLCMLQIENDDEVDQYHGKILEGVRKLILKYKDFSNEVYYSQFPKPRIYLQPYLYSTVNDHENVLLIIEGPEELNCQIHNYILEKAKEEKASEIGLVQLHMWQFNNLLMPDFQTEYNIKKEVSNRINVIRNDLRDQNIFQRSTAFDLSLRNSRDKDEVLNAHKEYQRKREMVLLAEDKKQCCKQKECNPPSKMKMMRAVRKKIFLNVFAKEFANSTLYPTRSSEEKQRFKN